MKWVTKTGQELDIKDMTDQHIKNCITMLKRANEKGVLRLNGFDIGEMVEYTDHEYYDEDIKEFEAELLKRKEGVNKTK